MIVSYIDEHRERVVDAGAGQVRLGVEPICQVLFGVSRDTLGVNTYNDDGASVAPPDCGLA